MEILSPGRELVIEIKILHLRKLTRCLWTFAALYTSDSLVNLEKIQLLSSSPDHIQPIWTLELGRRSRRRSRRSWR